MPILSNAGRIDHKRQLRCLALPLIVAAIWVMWLIAVAYSALLVTGHPYAFEVSYAAESLRFTHGANIYSTDILQQTAYLHGNCTPFPSLGYVYPLAGRAGDTAYSGPLRDRIDPLATHQRRALGSLDGTAGRYSRDALAGPSFQCSRPGVAGIAGIAGLLARL
jgi:hypothetical protein